MRVNVVAPAGHFGLELDDALDEGHGSLLVDLQV
jgi:hypothetical protein